MATRSTISVKQGDKVMRIYCHFDGYPSGTGKILKNHYATQELADKLIDLGDLSLLGESAECPNGHSYNRPKKGCTIAYGRDKKKSDVEATESSLKIDGTDYHYHWDGEKWLIGGVGGDVLTDEIIEND